MRNSDSNRNTKRNYDNNNTSELKTLSGIHIVVLVVGILSVPFSIYRFGIIFSIISFIYFGKYKREYYTTSGQANIGLAPAITGAVFSLMAIVSMS